MKVGYGTDPGRERPSNEDSYLIQLSYPWKVLAVADGMGGHAGGEIASSAAVETLRKKIDDAAAAGSMPDVSHAKDYFISILNQTNMRIWELSRREDLQGMGTTLSAVFTLGFNCLAGHIGDSRIYLIQNGNIKMVSRDHTLVEEMVLNGQLQASEAVNHPQRHVLTRALGTMSDVEFDFYSLPVQAGDILLLCSDGLSNMMSSDEMLRIVTNSRHLQQAADTLIEFANNQGGCDNITVVLALFEAEDEVI